MKIVLSIIVFAYCTCILAQPPMPPAPTMQVVTVVSNMPVWHNPYLIGMDGYSNVWLSLESNTNLTGTNWTEEQVFFFPTSTVVDMTNPPGVPKFYRWKVKQRINIITNNNP